MNEIEPQALPQEITKRKEAITLYFLGVGALAIVSVLTVIGGLVLAFAGKPATPEMWTFGSLALVALAGMVSRSESTSAG